MTQTINTFTWKTASGEIYTLDELSTEHILNIIKFLEKRMTIHKEKYIEKYGFTERSLIRLTISAIRVFEDELFDRGVDYLTIRNHIEDTSFLKNVKNAY